jgi:hypothetical protein
MATRLTIVEGQRFNNLVVIGEAPTIYLPCGQANRMITCKCDCGTVKDFRLLHLVRNRMVGCGCREWGIHRKDELLKKIYRAIKDRCNGKTKDPHRYLGKGITVCEEWLSSPTAFYDWAMANGYAHGLTIDRTDNSKGYSPENCRWVTSSVNVNNRDITVRIMYNGILEPLTPLLARLNRTADYGVIRERIAKGWDHQVAMNAPIIRPRRKDQGLPLVTGGTH